eukprot:jgi/Chlat1/2497/Chrsp175S02365
MASTAATGVVAAARLSGAQAPASRGAAGVAQPASALWGARLPAGQRRASSSSSSSSARFPSGRRHDGVTRAIAADDGLEVDHSVDFDELQELIRLVNSSDIVEFELKNSKFEMTLKKHEALAPPPAAEASYAPSFYPGNFQQYASPPQPAPAAPAPAPAAAAPAPAATSTSAPANANSSLPRILSPMAGTFYRCPAPGEPPFVEVGAKVTKGQVICIVEAMKLLNEIESEFSGTIVEMLAVDAKPVEVNQPLFVIDPNA